MTHEIFLIRGRDLPDVPIGKAETYEEAEKIYLDEIRHRGIHNEPYTRFWNDGATYIDFGSHLFLVKIVPGFSIFEMLGEKK